MRYSGMILLLLGAAGCAESRIQKTDAEGPAQACGTVQQGREWALVLHRYWGDSGQRGPVLAADPPMPAPGASADDVAALADANDLVVRKNPFDLDGRGARFSPVGSGYQVSPLTARPATPAGDPAFSPGEEVWKVDLPFVFPFYGRPWNHVFVHADGYLSFGAPLPPGAGPSLPRLISGPPAIGVFFADFDPARGGTVSVRTSADRAVAIWTDVPGGAQVNRNTFEATLFPDGSVEILFTQMETREGVVGLTPGAALAVAAVDLAAGAASDGALAETFSESERVDLVAVAQRFYRSYPDAFDQLIVYTTRPLNPFPGAFAFEIGVRSAASGIGVPPSDDGSLWGSPARLSSIVFMDTVETYREVDGFEILAHEVGHRWLARLRFRDGAGGASGKLLSADGVHWSFFFSSGASVLGGNDIRETAAGRFETVDFARGYGPLDQYAMGLRLAEEVPPFFIVEEADQFRPNRTYKASSSPEAGVQFTGRRETILIDDVISAMGPRSPGVDTAHVFKQAYVLVGDEQTPAADDARAIVARIRTRFETYFAEATEGRGRVVTSLTR